jgi:alpha-D-xyloside xylohydrolase
LAYRELYVRWLEYGTFLPMFRSHGTDTPREIWNFGKKGEKENATIVRSLLFDFLEDIEAGKIEDEFMFGNSILVCPITEPLYYDVGWFAVCTGKDK